MDRDRRIRMYDKLDSSTELPMLALAVIFLIVIVVQQVAPLSESMQLTLEGVEWMIWGVFAIELVAKTYLSPDRWRYLLRHWMDVIIVVFPFLRPLQLLRVVAVTARSWQSIRSILVHQTAGIIGIAGVALVFTSALLVWGFEQTGNGPIDSFPAALWWSVVTITTVGYGDMYPTTNIGRGIAVFLMVAGISLFGLLTARVAAFFVDEDDQASERATQRKMDLILTKLDNLEAQNRALQAQLELQQSAVADDS